jgi:hypothetical protein
MCKDSHVAYFFILATASYFQSRSSHGLEDVLRIGLYRHNPQRPGEMVGGQVRHLRCVGVARHRSLAARLCLIYAHGVENFVTHPTRRYTTAQPKRSSQAISYVAVARQKVLSHENHQARLNSIQFNSIHFNWMNEISRPAKVGPRARLARPIPTGRRVARSLKPRLASICRCKHTPER